MFWLVIITAILLDQLSKLIAPAMGLSVSINTGISFGWLAAVPAGLATLGLLVLVAALLNLWLEQNWFRYQCISGLFWAGVVSNLVDRVLLGGVTDWLILPGWHIKNNLADIYLVGALMVLLFVEVKKQHKEKIEEQSAA